MACCRQELPTLPACGRSVLAAAFYVSLLFAAPVTAQQPTVAENGAGENAGGDEATLLAQGRVRPGLLEGAITAGGGDPVANARVFVPDRGRAVRTDKNGAFQIELPPGEYSIEISHPDYATQTMDNVEVISGKAVAASLSLEGNGVVMDNYVITAQRYQEGSVVSEVNLQRESPQVLDAIGAEQIARTGDSDATEALQRISGLVIEDDKYVVVRGQPYRYSLTQFNGLPLPSPDPIIQAVPLDLFPAGLLANIQAQKSYSFDQPGNFGAGLIGLNTRSVPHEPFLELQVSTGGNDFSTFKNGLIYDGSNEDYLGQDSGDRELPSAVPPSRDALNAPGVDRDAVGRSFNDLFMVEEKENLLPDIGFKAIGGRSFPTEFGTYGFVLSGAYDHKWRHERERDITYATTDLLPRAEFVENRTDRNVQISSLLGLSGTWDNHSLQSNTFFIRDSQDRTQISEGYDLTSDGRDERRFLLEFQRREMLLTQLIGEHNFGFAQFDWRAQTADAERERPDRRDWSYERAFGTDNPFIFYADEALERQFNEVDENADSLALDLTVPFLRDSERFTTELKAGFDYHDRDRESETRRFQFAPTGGADLSDPMIERIINDQTIGDTIEFSETTLGTDGYRGQATTDGLYLGTDVRYRELLRMVAGLRRTNADYEVATNNGSTGGFDQDFTLPSLAVTGFVTPDMQIRGAFSETVSYPRLVELSDTTFFNPDSGEAFSGNPALEPTEIKSYDLRWEWYPSAVETLSLGVFYKDLTNTVEEQFRPVGGGRSQTTFVNGESAEIKGFEIGGRINLDRLADFGIAPERWATWLAQMYLQGNMAITDSEVDIGGGGGAATNRERALTGQADDVVNLQLGYDGPIHDVTLVVNRIGERLDRAGTEGLPDIFQEPSTILDLTYTWTIREDLPLIGKLPYVGDGRIKLKARNLLDEEEAYRQGGKIQRQIIYGRTFSASLKWNFF